MITNTHCRHHPQREAAARCPSCREFYCRECVTEHEDHMLCAACLPRTHLLSPHTGQENPWPAGLAQLFLGLLSLLLLWSLFYGFGRLLLAIPSHY